MPKRKRKVVRPLPRPEFAALVAGAREPWRTMMIVQHAFGLRPGEVCKLRAGDVDLDAGTLITPRDGKTGERLVAFDRDGHAAQALSAWLEVHGGEYVFGGDRPALVNSYRKALARYCDRLQSVRVKPYALRHTYACELMDAGVPIATIAEALGHASVSTTARYYLHPNEELLRRVNAGR